MLLIEEQEKLSCFCNYKLQMSQEH